MKEIDTMNAGLLMHFFRCGEAQLTGHKDEVNALNVYPGFPMGIPGQIWGLPLKAL